MKHKYPITFQAIHESNVQLNSLKEFDSTKIGNNTGNNGLYGFGAYVSLVNSKYLGYGKIKNKVEVKLNCPFIISKNNILNTFYDLDKKILSEIHVHFNLNCDQNAFQIIMRGLDPIQGNTKNILMTKKLQKMGFDGVILQKNQIIIESVVFDNAPCR